jgi:hypothetical protein
MCKTERIIKMCQHFNEPVRRNDFEPAASKRCEKIRQGRDDAEGDIQRLELPREVKAALAEIGNHGLAKSHWSNYGTAERMLMRCRKDTDRKMELPLGKEDVLIFVDWLIRVRKVIHGTVSNYLAGIRQLHVMKGMEVPQVRSSLVNLIITGKKNMERMEKLKKTDKGRLPVTLTVMRLLKATLREASMENQEKLLTWAGSSNCPAKKKAGLTQCLHCWKKI